MLRYSIKSFINSACRLYVNPRLITSRCMSSTYYFKEYNASRLFCSKSDVNTIQARILLEIDHIRKSESELQLSRLEKLYEEITTNTKLYSNPANDKYEESFDQYISLIAGKIQPKHLYSLFKIVEKLNCFSNTFTVLVINALEINESKDDQIELSQFLEILTLSKEKSSSKDLYSKLLKYFYDMNSKQKIIKKVLDLDLNGLISYFKIFSSSFSVEDQQFIDSLLKILIESYPIELEKNGYSLVKSLMASSMEILKGGANFNMIYDHYLPLITNEFSLINCTSQVDFIYFYSIKIQESLKKNMQVDLTPRDKKLFKTAENEITENGFDAYKLFELVLIIDSFSSLNLGSDQFYSGIEEHITKSIERVSCDSYLGLVSSFIPSKKGRNKFLTLISKKIIENREHLEINKLTNLVFIYSAHFEGSDELLESLHDYFCGHLAGLEYEDIARLCKAYLTLKPHKNYLICNDLEEIISKSMLPHDVQIVIEYLEAFIAIKKGKIEFLKKLVIRILEFDTESNDELMYTGVQSLYTSVSHLKEQLSLEDQQLVLSKLTKFDEILQKKSIHFNLSEIQTTLTALRNLGYENSNLAYYFEELHQIQEESESSNNESTSFLQKVGLLTKYQNN